MSSNGHQEGRLSRWTITTGAWVLVGILLITAALLFSARVEERINPSVTNVQPSGYAAFSELLKRDGYDVVLERDATPEFRKGDVVISTEFGEYDNDNDPFATASFDEFDEEFDAVEYEEFSLEPYQTALQNHIEAGGTVINVYSRMNFEEAEENVFETVEVVSSSDPLESYSVTVPYGFQYLTPLPYDKTIYGGWNVGTVQLVSYTAVNDGLLVSINDGFGMCNRYLDQEDNAAFYLDVVREVVPHGSRIVIIEAGIGNVVIPSVTNTLGNWAVFARWQALLLFVVLVFTLARRFGLPEIDRKEQKGSRELFDAIADVFRRSNNTGLALDSLLIEADDRIRSVIRAPRAISRSAMLQRVPTELKEQYLNVSEFAVSKCTPREATQAAQKLAKLLEDFENDSRSARGLKR